MLQVWIAGRRGSGRGVRGARHEARGGHSACSTLDARRRFAERTSRRRSRGATYVEYLILLGVVALAALAGVRHFGAAVTSTVEAQRISILTFTAREQTAGPRPGSVPAVPAPGVAPAPVASVPRAPVKPGSDRDEKQCSNFFSCGWERAKDNYEKYPSPLRFSEHVWRGVWDDVSGAFTDTWDLGEALLTDPGSVWDGIKDAASYTWDHPGEVALGLVWDEESQALWDEGKWDGAVGRTAWNVGSYFIPGIGEVKAAARLGKVFRKAAELGADARRDRGDHAGSEEGADDADAADDGDEAADEDGSDDDGGGEEDPEGDDAEEPVCAATSGVCERPGSCFAAGTLVHAAAGLRPIEQIMPGDEVWSQDERTGEIALRRVAERFVTLDRPLLIITVTDGAGSSESLRVTPEHPFWTAAGWTSAKDLVPEDVVQLVSGDWVDVTSGQSLSEPATVYNFEVADFHTYFVGAQGLWVHNECELNADGTFKDPTLEAAYQNYRKQREDRGKAAMDRQAWNDERERQHQQQGARRAEAQRILDEIGAIGTRARADLEAIPGGRELLARIDSETDPTKKLEQTQVAAVALEAKRNGANVSAVEREYPNPGGGEATKTDVETDEYVIEVKGKDMSKPSSVTEKDRKQADKHRRIARDSGREHVIRVPSANDKIAGKMGKNGTQVDQSPFRYDLLGE